MAAALLLVGTRTRDGRPSPRDPHQMKISEAVLLVHRENVLYPVQWDPTYFMCHRERAKMELRAARLLTTEGDDLVTPDRHVQ